MTLPTAKSLPSKKWTDQKTLMIGPGKVGKSAFWAQGDKTLFMECEAGLNHLSVMKVPIRCWDDVRNMYGELAAVRTALPYDTCVIDTGDKLAEYAGEEVVEIAKNKFSKAIEKGLEINSIGDVPEGGGWYQWTRLVHSFLDKLAEMNMHIVVISHYNMKEISEPTRKYHKETISIGGQCGTKLLHWADHTLNVKAEYIGSTLKRKIVTVPSISVEAGSRGGLVPNGFEITTDIGESYKRFRSLFD